jgi:hypothetical protein
MNQDEKIVSGDHKERIAFESKGQRPKGKFAWDIPTEREATLAEARRNTGKIANTAVRPDGRRVSLQSQVRRFRFATRRAARNQRLGTYMARQISKCGKRRRLDHELLQTTGTESGQEGSSTGQCQRKALPLGTHTITRAELWRGQKSPGASQRTSTRVRLTPAKKPSQELPHAMAPFGQPESHLDSQGLKSILFRRDRQNMKTRDGSNWVSATAHRISYNTKR